jgi:hypothetical protein
MFLRSLFYVATPDETCPFRTPQWTLWLRFVGWSVVYPYPDSFPIFYPQPFLTSTYYPRTGSLKDGIAHHPKGVQVRGF